MRIRLIDTYEQIRRLRERSQPLSPETYRSYAEGVSPALYEKCLRDSASYDFTSQILPVLEDALFRRFDRVAAAHQALEEIAAFVPARAGELLLMILRRRRSFISACATGRGGRRSLRESLPCCWALKKMRSSAGTIAIPWRIWFAMKQRTFSTAA